MTYAQIHQTSINSPETFWAEQARALSWYKQPQTIIGKDANGVDRWFVDGELNTCYLALDVHVEAGRGDTTAMIYDSPVADKKHTYSYTQMRDEVAQLAGVLADLGVEKGDTVLIYMPMIPQAVFAMLACARLGAIHSVVFGGFASNELAVRIDDAAPKVILSASCGLEPGKQIPYKPLLDAAIDAASHKPQHTVIFQREQLQASLDRDTDKSWLDLLEKAQPADCVPVLATDPLYILYTSGTTGIPKGILRDNGGHAVAMKYSMQAIYDIAPGEVFWAASDVGWVVGHSYIVYAPLIHGCTTVLYEGKPVGTPDAGAFWRVIEEYRVKALFAAPTAFRAIKKQDPGAALAGNYNLDSLQTLFVAGERLDPPTYHWLHERFNVPVIDHWWQTETGWAIAANLVGIECLPTKPGSACKPSPGFDVRILDDDGNELRAGEQGHIAVKLPLPPSCLPGIWNDFPRFKHYYLDPFPGFYLSGDGGYLDEDGYLFVLGRTDDVINIAGHRLSTGRMEEVVGSHDAVAECAVVGVNDELKGQLPVGFVLLKDGVAIESATLSVQVEQLVRQEIGAIACLKQIHIVTRLPKTRSGKILRNVMRQIMNAEDYTVPSTIDDPASLEEIKTLAE